MKTMREIKKNGAVLARHITQADIKTGPELFFPRMKSSFRWVFGVTTKKREELKAHIHNTVERTVNRTYETLYVIKGALEAVIYDMDETPVETLQVRQGEILVLLESGHGYFIKEDDTTVLEVKNGPYLGAEIDRRRI